MGRHSKKFLMFILQHNKKQIDLKMDEDNLYDEYNPLVNVINDS